MHACVKKITKAVAEKSLRVRDVTSKEFVFFFLGYRKEGREWFGSYKRSLVVALREKTSLPSLAT